MAEETPTETAPAEAGGGRVLLLVSSMPATLQQEQNILRARSVLNGRKIAYTEVDGAEAADKELRNTLFGVSNRRGDYPQFFIETGGSYLFAGDWEKIEMLNEMADIDADTLGNIRASDPSFQSLDELFDSCERVE